jgi:hypothetical protein
MMTLLLLLLLLSQNGLWVLFKEDLLAHNAFDSVRDLLVVCYILLHDAKGLLELFYLASELVAA